MNRLVTGLGIAALAVGTRYMIDQGDNAYDKPSKLPEAVAQIKRTHENNTEQRYGSVSATADQTIILNNDAQNGARIFKTKCAQCHTLDNSNKHKQGPNLYNIIGRAAGSANGYEYSAANKSSGIIWMPMTLDEYLTDPRGYIKGTKMIFAGIKSQSDRKQLIEYMEKLNN